MAFQEPRFGNPFVQSFLELLLADSGIELMGDKIDDGRDALLSTALSQSGGKETNSCITRPCNQPNARIVPCRPAGRDSLCVWSTILFQNVMSAGSQLDSIPSPVAWMCSPPMGATSLPCPSIRERPDLRPLTGATHGPPPHPPPLRDPNWAISPVWSLKVV
ncbi:hypothetical protein CIHG_04458 [Coccidioides immitis H538.4]|uniref:Uncharacterized protein n=3 Tax=Coccidioides immitis TaxID=5501 RepID=A0A0J8R7D7_COCIT|nr:hypothetical protein CIRG_09389 [Coccidioides immitis RMSCC 2394]KMU80776.1 hypothetical protein CISG_08579 [Coccidioides immitis RMSCC 3703]KMU86669.1 hypothetical protein CIHG_04458 [Coccidioides immitis H538.4]